MAGTKPLLNRRANAYVKQRPTAAVNAIRPRENMIADQLAPITSSGHESSHANHDE